VTQFVLTVNYMKANVITLGFSSSNNYARMQMGPCLLIESRAKVHVEFKFLYRSS